MKRSNATQHTQRARKRLLRWMLVLSLLLSISIVGCGKSGEIGTLQQPLTEQEIWLQTLQQIQTKGALLRGEIRQAQSTVAQARTHLLAPKVVADGLGTIKETLGIANNLSHLLKAIPAIRTPMTKLQKSLNKFRDKVASIHTKVKRVDSTYISPIRFRLKQIEAALQRAQDQLEMVEDIAADNERASTSLSAYTECDTLLATYIKLSQPVATQTLNAILLANTTVATIKSKLNVHLSLDVSGVLPDIIRHAQAFVAIAGNFDISLGRVFGQNLSLGSLVSKLRGVSDILEKKIDFGLFSMSIRDALDAASWIIDKAKGLLKPVLEPIEELLKIPSISLPGLDTLTDFLDQLSPHNALSLFEADFQLLQLPKFASIFTLNSDIADISLVDLCTAGDAAFFAQLPASIQRKFYSHNNKIEPCPHGAECRAGQTIPCPTGSYCIEGEASSCASLPAKYYCEGSLRKLCPYGSQCIQGKKQACPDSYTHTKGTTTYITNALYCEAGIMHDCFEMFDGLHYCEINAAGTGVTKARCPKGTVCARGRAYACSPGYGCGWVYKRKCDELGPYLYCDGMALTPCPKGAYCDKGKVLGTCTELSSDAYCTTRTPTDEEISLEVARQEIGTVSVKVDCPANTSYCKQGVRYDCPSATTGEYCTAGARASCDTLPAGYMCKNVGGINHKVACDSDQLSDPFSYCEGGQVQSCSQLDPFLYCADNTTEGSPTSYVLLPCPRGWRCSNGTKQACPSGHECAQGVATPCPANTACNTATRANTYYEESGQKLACDTLESGYHCTLEGCSTADCGASLAGVNRRKETCPAGAYCALGLVQGQCSALDHRYYCEGTALTPCPQGSYCEQGQARSCALLSNYNYCAGSQKKPCPRSQFLCRKGTKTPCPYGSFCLSSGQYSCATLAGTLVCKDGSYAGCPAGHSCQKGIPYKCSELPSSSYCKRHTYGTDEHKAHGYRQRMDCPKESYCVAGEATSCQTLSKDFYCKDNNKEACPKGFLCAAGKLVICPLDHTCNNGVASPCTEGMACAGGYAHTCPEDKYCTGGRRYPKGTQFNGSLSGLYVTLEKNMYRVNTQSGTWSKLGNASWTNTKAMAAIGGSIYAIQYNHMYKASATDGTYTSYSPTSWSNTHGMTAIGDQLYVAAGGSLYKVDTTNNGSYTRLGTPNEWWYTKASHAMGELYMLQGGETDSLYHANKTTGAWARRGSSGGWDQAQAMTSINGHLYIVAAGNLYKVDPADGSRTNLSANCNGTWQGARLAVSKGGELFIMTVAEWSTSSHRVREFRMYRVDTTTQCTWTNIGSKRNYHTSAPPALSGYTFSATAIH